MNNECVRKLHLSLPAVLSNGLKNIIFNNKPLLFILSCYSISNSLCCSLQNCCLKKIGIAWYLGNIILFLFSNYEIREYTLSATYSDRLWHLNIALLVSGNPMCPRKTFNYNYTNTTSLIFRDIDLGVYGFIPSVLTLPSACHSSVMMLLTGCFFFVVVYKLYMFIFINKCTHL